MGCFKKLKFWRRWRRRRDGPVSQKHSEEHRKNLDEGDTNTEHMLHSGVAEVREILEERDREEDNLRLSVTECEKTLEKTECSKNQAEAELYGWISLYTNQLKAEISKRNQMEATFRDTISGLEKQLEETTCLKNETEGNLFELEKKLKEKDRELEAACREKTIILEKKLEEQFLKNDTEAILLELEKKLKEKDRERDQMEATFRATIIGIEKQLEETKCLKNKTEASLLEASLLEANLLGLEKKLEEKDRERDQMEGIYHDKIMVLQWIGLSLAVFCLWTIYVWINQRCVV